MQGEYLVYYLAGVPLLGIVAQWLAWRFRLPSILLLLAFGIALGSFVTPDRLLADLAGVDIGAQLLLPAVSLAVAVILFEGGLTLRIGELKTAGEVVFRLVTVGAVVSWLLTSLAAKHLFGLDTQIAALAGAVLVVTGPTVVAPLLRHIRPSRRVGSIVKWEGIVIDPIGALLAVLVFEQVSAHDGDASWWSASLVLGKTVLIGGLLGLATAVVLIQFVKRYWIPDFLHGVVFLTAALGVFAVSNWLQPESGLATVTLLGVILANQKSIPIHHVVEFKEHLRVFLISCLFIVLGSRLRPSDLLELGAAGLVFLAVLILFIRPASVLISTLRTDLSWRERAFLAFLAPRGIVAAAVSSVFALKLTLGDPASGNSGLEGADQLVPITFFVIVGTVAVYGLLAAPLAQRLKLADPNPQGVLFAGAEPWVRDIAAVLQQEGYQVLLVDTNYANVAAARMAGLPADCCSILSEHVRDELDLSGIGRMLAMTPNDEVNALAVREFTYVFGRAQAYQLPPGDAGSGRRASIAGHLQGRLLFAEGLGYDELVRQVHAGAVVKKTQLSKEFPYEDFQALYGESAVLLFIRGEAKNLEICTAEKPTAPKPGQTVVALVNPPADDC